MIIAVLGHIPTTPGDTITLDGWTFETTQIGRHAITQVRIAPVQRSTDDTGDPNAQE
jgi:putative hemolysin